MRIFISYGHDRHVHIAERLSRDLQQSGHDVWFDKERLKSKLGVDWEAYIEKGLDWAAEDPNMGRALFLMTPHSVRRPDGFCLNELTRALNRQLKIIPVMLVWCEPPLSICRLQWLDMQDCLPLSRRRRQYGVRYRELLSSLENPQTRSDAGGRLLRLLQPLPFEADLLPHLTRFTGRDWLIREIDEWLRASSEPRIFWIVGDPGVGKTALAAQLCWKHPRIAALHLCEHGHTLKADPRRCFMSIAYQLATQLKDYASRLAELNLEQIVPESNAEALFDMLLVQPFSRNFSSPEHPVVILIDALDEASAGIQNEIAGVVAKRFHQTPGWLRMILTSRPEPSVQLPLQGLTPYFLKQSARENMEDVREFLTQELRVLPGSKPEELSAEIEAVLTESEGVFLYAEMIRRERKEGCLAAEAVHSYPKGLGGVFFQAFRRQFPDLAFYRTAVRPILEAVIAARAAVPPQALAAIFGWDECQLDEMCAALGALFPSTANGIRPFHKSLVEWLTEGRNAGCYRVSERQGHERLAAFGWWQYETGALMKSSYFLASLPVHLAAAEQWDRLERFLADPTFIRARCDADAIFDVVRDLAMLDRLKRPVSPVVESLTDVFKDRLLEPMRQQLRSALNQSFGSYDTWPLSLRQKLEQSTDLMLVLFLGDTLDMEERFDQAEVLYRRLWTTTGPDRPRDYATACARLAEILEHQNRPQEGLEITEQFNAQPGLRERCGRTYYWWVQYQRGICLRRLHRYDEAVALFAQVGAAESGHEVSALHQLGVIDLELNRLDEAKAKFEEGLRRRSGQKWNHRCAFEHRRIGQILALSGHPVEARAALERALTISINCGNHRYATQVRRDFITLLDLPELERRRECQPLRLADLVHVFHVTETELRMTSRVLWREGRGYVPVISPETGAPTGEAVRWEVAHRRGDWHATVMVLIFDADGNLALQERRESDSQGRLDVSVSGHVEIGEPDILAAIRETAEETGLITGAMRLVRVGKPLQWIKEGSPDVITDEHEGRYMYRYRTNKVNRERVSVFALRIADQGQLKAGGFHWHSLPDAARMAGEQPAHFASAFKHLLHPETLDDLDRMIRSGKVWSWESELPGR